MARLKLSTVLIRAKYLSTKGRLRSHRRLCVTKKNLDWGPPWTCVFSQHNNYLKSKEPKTVEQNSQANVSNGKVRCHQPPVIVLCNWNEKCHAIRMYVWIWGQRSSSYHEKTVQPHTHPESVQNQESATRTAPDWSHSVCPAQLPTVFDPRVQHTEETFDLV